MLFKNIRWLSLATIVNHTSWFISIGIFATAIGPSDFGSFSFILSFWLMFFKIGGLGTEIWITKFISQESSRGAQVSALNGFMLRMAISTTIFFATIIYTSINSFAVIDYLLLFISIGFRQIIEGVREYLIGIIQGYQRMDLQAKAIIPIEINQLALIATMHFILSISDPLLMFLPFLISSILKILSLHRALKPLNPKIWNKNALSPSILKILKESYPIGIMAIVYMTYIQSQVIILKFAIDSKEVGIYSASLLIITAADIIMGIIRQAQFPKLTQIYKKEPHLFYKKITKYYLYYLALSLSLTLIILFLSITSIRYIPFGEYNESIENLKYFALLIPIFSTVSFWGNAINASNQSQVAAKWIILFFFIALPINILLIYEFASFGAFLFLFISSGLLSYFYFSIIKKNFK